VYTFGADGKLCYYHGITDMANGTKRYYQNAQLMICNGLTKVGENYIYVRTSGELVVSNSYYVPENDLEIAPGTYSFDENGFMINPISTAKKGVYLENGGWFYYEKGVRACNKGLISVTANWVDGDSTVERTGVIYVRSNGQLATGSYYVTKIGDTDLGIASGDKVSFDQNGLMVNTKNGIVAENGSLFYYVDNVRAYNAGVIQLDGKYYYVRSNGELVHGRSYWITNVGDSGVAAKQYTFDENGVMLNPVFTEGQFTGIKDGYYYENGVLAYGKGVVYLEAEGCFIYVRSNGQLATGKYWPTNTNGYLDPGSYDWGTDGKLYL
jgi:glucan-binding YG repeat protein